ncbi:hypothetical protein DRO55_00150 [Candidatus Bathyarchaeota archaeon]|nr:MAG: hypothetical protein DRO55_00150 [Candidatus Bathyarchaeota archaeon]
MNVEEEAINYLRRGLGSDVLDAAVMRERRVSVRVKPEALRRAVELLRDGYPKLRFITISTVDHGLDFEFLHHFHIGGTILTLRTVKPKEENTLESIADIIPAANFIEREIADLFGVRLLNHPKPRNLILTKDWPDDKRPLRKPFVGELPRQARPVAEALISTGCVAPASSFIQRRRESAGLPRTPPFTFADEESMKEFHGVIRGTGLDEKVGFDWKSGKLRYK